jgi:hypothetical protein
MSMSFDKPLCDQASRDLKEKLDELFNVEAMDEKQVLFNPMKAINARAMSDIARTVKQPVTLELNEIGDRKEIGGIVYELDEKGWRKLPIGAKL